MKILKQLLKVFIALFGLILVVLASILMIDSWNTSYLKIKIIPLR